MVDEQSHLILRVPGRVRHLEFEFLPAEPLAMTESPIHFERFAENAPEVLAARVLEDVHHVLVAPDLCREMALQMGEAVQVIVVHVARHRDIDRLHAEVAAQVADRVFDEADAIIDARSIQKRREMPVRSRTVIDKHRLAAVADDGVKDEVVPLLAIRCGLTANGW